MSDAIVPPSPAVVLRRFVARMWDEPETRSTLIGVLGVLLIYLLMWLIGPGLLRLSESAVVLTPSSTARQFNIQINPESFLPPPVPKRPPVPKQFVETNPDAPENTPDRTNNFGAQNQQVAQEKPTPNGQSERPVTEGKKDFQPTQIVSGRLEKQVQSVPVAPPAPPTPPAQTTASPPRAAQNPLPGFEKMQGDNPNGYGTNVAPEAPNARPIPNRVEGEQGVPLIEGATGTQPAIDPKHPRPRPSIVRQQQVRPAILAENNVGTRNIGTIAINAKFNQYGLYLQRLIDAVQLEFDKLVSESQTYPPVGSYVVVRWKLNSEGRVSAIVNVENHSTDLGAQTCLAAISNRQPFGEWTDDMKSTLNPDGEELLFTFYFQ